jgi:hypothetical protein
MNQSCTNYHIESSFVEFGRYALVEEAIRENKWRRERARSEGATRCSKKPSCIMNHDGIKWFK